MNLDNVIRVVAAVKIDAADRMRLKSDNYFKITDKEGSLEFNLHFILKYGRVEVVMESKDHGTGVVVGGLFAMSGKLIELSGGIDRDRYMAKPAFRNYDDLREIFKVTMG